MLICSFRKENFECEQLTFERNKFRKGISQFRTCSILRNFAEKISLMERSDWSVGQCLQTSNEASTASSMLAFESLFQCEKCSLSKQKKNF